MKTLVFPESRLETCVRPTAATISLREWLDGRWAILFSHPEDFLQEQLEMDRWLSVLGRSVRTHDVRLLALAGPGRDTVNGWLGRLAELASESAAVLLLDAPQAGTLVDLTACALRTSIDYSGPRFAMIIDSSMRCRRVLSYRGRAQSLSPFDLIGWAVSLRGRARAEVHTGDLGDDVPLIRPDWLGRRSHSAAQAAHS